MPRVRRLRLQSQVRGLPLAQAAGRGSLDPADCGDINAAIRGSPKHAAVHGSLTPAVRRKSTLPSTAHPSLPFAGKSTLPSAAHPSPPATADSSPEHVPVDPVHISRPGVPCHVSRDMFYVLSSPQEQF